LIQSYFCEWTEAVKDPERRKLFQQFANTEESIIDTIEPVEERGQQRPSYWPKESATEDFRGTKWSSLSWQPMLQANEFSNLATGDSKAVKRGDTQLAIFKVRGTYYCTQQMCPHKRAFVLSDGLIGEDLASNRLWVSCPHHKRNYELSGADAGKCGNDDTLNIATFPVEERDDGWIYVKLPPVVELDSVLGTSKWKIRKDETPDPFINLDNKLKAMKGRKSLRAGYFENSNGEISAGNGILVGNGASKGMDW